MNPIPINQDGLLYCCAADIYNNEIQTEEGSPHKCQYCGTYIKIIDGAWTWAQIEREDFGGEKK